MAVPILVSPSLPAELEPVAGRPLGLAELIELVRDVAAREDVWRPKLQFPQGADRWWTRLHDSANVDVWLLSWLPGHATDLHDHGASAAAFTVLQGRLDEARLARSQRQLVRARVAGTTSWVAPHVLHDVRAAGTGAAVSIHAYSPPLTEMTFWAKDGSGLLRPARTVLTDEPEQA
jgi:predicted metal-dependent enzyme (double-stranded beta helix superfamily)